MSHCGVDNFRLASTIFTCDLTNAAFETTAQQMARPPLSASLTPDLPTLDRAPRRRPGPPRPPPFGRGGGGLRQAVTPRGRGANCFTDDYRAIAQSTISDTTASQASDTTENEFIPKKIQKRVSPNDFATHVKTVNKSLTRSPASKLTNAEAASSPRRLTRLTCGYAGRQS